ncbi:MAG: type II toxin-antitoxin system VapC family toxin [Ignavibacteriaceae bacterium]|jgi:predicted nucleic acid-binding protein|nr:type II toxin-antitoxin system VapC family toxin [Ignavibacteriaceae bacterium]
MNLHSLDPSKSIILDANILLYGIQRKSKQCVELISRIGGGELNCYITSHILAEVMHVLMIEEARSIGEITGGNPARKLSEKPGLVNSLYLYESVFEDILNLGMNIEVVEKQDLIEALAVQRKYGLLTNDSLIIAVAKRLRITSLVSADKVFAKVRSITLYSPDDII